jgi:hypothetical protein
LDVRFIVDGLEEVGGGGNEGTGGGLVVRWDSEVAAVCDGRAVPDGRVARGWRGVDREIGHRNDVEVRGQRGKTARSQGERKGPVTHT